MMIKILHSLRQLNFWTQIHIQMIRSAKIFSWWRLDFQISLCCLILLITNILSSKNTQDTSTKVIMKDMTEVFWPVESCYSVSSTWENVWHKNIVVCRTNTVNQVKPVSTQHSLHPRWWPRLRWCLLEQCSDEDSSSPGSLSIRNHSGSVLRSTKVFSE